MLFWVRVLECAEQSIFFPSFTGRILGEGDVLRDLCDWKNNFGSHAIYLSREKMIAWLPIKFSILHDKIWGKNAPNTVFCDLHNCTILMHQCTKRSEEVADSIVYLVRQIEYSCDATVTISELVCWRGKLDQAFNTASKLLIKFCHQNEWKLIRHQNITYNRLNKGGLHLHLKVTNS